jgi:hypothetical protein
LWVAGGVGSLFPSPRRLSDWCLTSFAVVAGLAGILVGVRPLLGPDAARLAGRAAVGCAVLATGAGLASLWLGERDSTIVVWLIFAGGVVVFWAVRLAWRVRGRAVVERPDV